MGHPITTDGSFMAYQQGRSAYPKKLRGDNPYREFIKLDGDEYLRGMRCYDSWDKGWKEKMEEPTNLSEIGF
jgi:hypothetical protein